MNSLSWLLYFGDVSHNIGGVFLALAMISFFYVSVISIGASLDREQLTLAPHAGKVITVMIISAVLCALMPSQETVYMIAASQMGQKVITSQAGQNAEQLLNTYITKEIKKLKQENSN